MAKMKSKRKKFGTQVWRDVIAFAVDEAKRDPSFHRKAAVRMSKITGEAIHKNQAWQWLQPDGAEPKAGTALVLIEVARSLVNEARGKGSGGNEGN